MSEGFAQDVSPPGEEETVPCLDKSVLTIPVERIPGTGKVVPGFAKVLDVIGDPESAWAFVTNGRLPAGAAAGPLDTLA